MEMQVSEELQTCQQGIDEASLNSKKETIEAHKKYLSNRAELFKKRGEIISQEEPKFWSKVFLMHRDIDEILGPHDPEIFEDLIDIEVKENVDDAGFCITLRFGGKNTFFHDEVLWKSFNAHGAPVSKSGVQWKEGKFPRLPAKLDGIQEQDSFATFFIFFMVDQEADTEAELAGILKLEVWEDPFTTLIGEDEDSDDEPDALAEEHA